MSEKVSASTTVTMGAGKDVSLPVGPHLEYVVASDPLPDRAGAPLPVGAATLASSADGPFTAYWACDRNKYN